MPARPTFPDSIRDDLDTLAHLHDRGLLVPFLGAGMSVHSSKTWSEFVEALERDAGLARSNGAEASKPDDRGASLVRRANAAVRRLRRRPDADFAESIRAAITNSTAIPRQTLALARLDWDLVLTTNYDDHFYRAFRASGSGREATRPLQVRGRDALDCQAVLASLESPWEPVLWALQGFLHRKRPFGSDDAAHLARELVVGHVEYRRTAHTALHFRRAFAEVFRKRTLLFLGSSLTDAYLLDLFGEVVELFGPVGRPHFALIPASSSVDDEFLRSRLHIRALRYDDSEGHESVESFIAALASRVDALGAAPRAWTFPCVHSPLAVEPTGKAGRTTTVDVVLGSLTSAPFDAEREALCISSGIQQGEYYIDPGVRRALREDLDTEVLGGARVMRTQCLWQFVTSRDDTRVIAGSPWYDDDHRDIRLVSIAAREAFEWAERNRVQRLRMALLGAGANRHFSSVISLGLILRAWREWTAEANRRLTLAVYVVDRDARRALTSGRFDPAELLSSDSWRFWAEVVGLSGAEREATDREPITGTGATTVAEVASLLDVELDDRWEVVVDPPAMREARAPIAAESTLVEIGLAPGATLRFAVRPREQAERAGE